MSTRTLALLVTLLLPVVLSQGCQSRTDRGSSSSLPSGDGGADVGRKPPADDVFNGIGWACNSEDDCNSGTYCRYGYCTAECDAGTTCESRFGGFTRCMDGECVATCARNDECHPFMTCNMYSGYCARAGWD